MNSKLKDHLLEQLERRDEFQPNEIFPHISYGTAGFRGTAESIQHLFYKVGMISGFLRAHERANVGLMITASHNHHSDNGVKIINKKGEMLDSEWEQVVEKICNIQDPSNLISELDKVVRRFNIDLTSNHTGLVLIGYDTRESSVQLAELVQQGLSLLGESLGKFHNFGLQTTPILHYLVAESNLRQNCQLLGPETYYNQISSGIEASFDTSKVCQYYNPNELVVDCSNGVGAIAMQLLNERLKTKSEPFEGGSIQLINAMTSTLNENCGADFVKTNKKAPVEVDEININKRYASFDGDADRIVYFYLERDESKLLKLNLLDGDKIMALFGLYLKELLNTYKLDKELSLGFIQTAYANGASTEYLTKNLGAHVDFADTGVKNLHKKAVQYDLGIYFEANGHGTIWISSQAVNAIKSKQCPLLLNLLKLLNNYTGDAISDLFIVESILHHYDWDIKKWDKVYEDRPNSLIKIAVDDRTLVKTANAGRTCVAPEGLQAEIDKVVATFGQEARGFVRPSGTEDVLRIYAEACTQELANKLAEMIGEVSQKFCARS